MLTKNLLKIALAALAGQAVAEPAMSPGLSENDFFADLPVVLSVSRLAQPLRDAPGAVTVIDAEMIRASGARDLADLLRLVPGFLVAQSFNGAPMAVYHGMTEENPRGMQILVDGRSQYSPLFFGGVGWNTIDVILQDIQRIEVIRGSNSAAYGANAFLGVVNIVTYHAGETGGLALEARQGNDSIQDRYGRLGHGAGEGNFRWSAERVSDHGIRDFNDSRETTRAVLRGDVRLGPRSELGLQAGVLDLTLGAGAPGAGTNPLRDQRVKRYFAQSSLNHALGEGADLALRVTRVEERYYDAFTVVQGPLSLAIDYYTRTARNEVEAQHTFSPTPTTRVVWGAGYRGDEIRARQFYDSDDTLVQRIHRLFGNAEWRAAPALLFNLGATWEHETLAGSHVSPRLAANVHLADGQTLRVVATQSHRVPTLTEARSKEFYGVDHPAARALGVTALEIDRWASGNLRPERIDALELSYLGELPRWRTTLDVRAFDERIHDRIVSVVLPLPAGTTDLFGNRYKDYLNAQDVRVRGIEYELVWRPRDGSRFSVAQTFLDVTSRANERLRGLSATAAADAERHMNNSAPRQASVLTAAQRLPWGIAASVYYYRYARFQWTSNTAVGPFHRLDWRLAYPFRAARLAGEVAFTVNSDGGRHTEFREFGADPADPNPASPQYLYPRSFLSLRIDL